ncbi:hypothetical protein AgCh_002092 [Apium graveolens]
MLHPNQTSCQNLHPVRQVYIYHNKIHKKCFEKANELVPMEFPAQTLDVKEMMELLVMEEVSIEPLSKVLQLLFPVQMLVVQYDEEAENRAETSAAGAARNRGVPAKLFATLVGGVLEILKTNPSTYQRQLNEEEVENLARAALDLSDPGNRTEFTQFVSNEVLHLVKELVEDMFKRYQEKEKEVLYSSDEETDVTDISDDESDVEAADGEGQNANGEEGASEGEDEEGNFEGSSREDD